MTDNFISMKKSISLFVIVFIVAFGGTTLAIKQLKAHNIISSSKPSNEHHFGDAIDSLNHVKVYYNGAIANVKGRNVVAGYNLGLKYQCVEFVKRYYYEYYKHKMPDSYGHAKSFFNKTIADGSFNKSRGLTQYSNPSQSKPKIGDLIVMDGSIFNTYGHVAIVASVTENSITIIQQNPGKTAPSRVDFPLIKTANKWQIKHKRILGWLRK